MSYCPRCGAWKANRRAPCVSCWARAARQKPGRERVWSGILLFGVATTALVDWRYPEIAGRDGFQQAGYRLLGLWLAITVPLVLIAYRYFSRKDAAPYPKLSLEVRPPDRATPSDQPIDQP
jgi:hypothetical protein